MSIKISQKNNKVNYFGIEVDPEITWNRWEPGKKYTKKLVLKNVKFSTQKLNFCVPAKEVFTTTFPKTITLSAGTSFQLPITFKPHRKDVFIDKIDFQNTDGELFSVPVRALLPQYAVEMNEQLSCGTVAVHDLAQRQIVVRNISELPTSFKWYVIAPYSIEPSHGTFEPFQVMEFTISFRPQDVGTYTMIIPFLYGNKLMHNKTLTVSSVAKYPNISIMIENLNQIDLLNKDNQLEMDFGTGSVGEVYEKLLHVQNMSEVDASVEIFRVDDTNAIDWVFFPCTESSKVPGRSFISILFRYQPKVALTRYVENFQMKISNKCGTYHVKCIAETDGPAVTISETHINFNQLNMGEELHRSILLYNNNSRSYASFQFLLDSGYSVFHLDRAVGTIKPGDHTQVVISFQPQQPIQYYRRLICLVPDQSPIFIDLLGTCHDIHFRPQILGMKHLKNFQQRQTAGLSYLPPELLMRHLAKLEIDYNEEKCLSILKDEEMKGSVEMVPDLSTWKEYFFTDNDTDIAYYTPYVGQDIYSLYFQAVEFVDKDQIKDRLMLGLIDSKDISQMNIYQQTFNIKNNTKGSIIIQWTISNDTHSSQQQLFSVEPNKIELSASETYEFNVIFRPDGSNKLFGAELEAFCYYKSQRQFELVDESLISPPFCLLVKCVGHTFINQKEPFLPKYEIDRTEVVFPSVNTGEIAFRSFSVTNTSSQPLIFQCSKMNEPFGVKPQLGFIQPFKKQIFTVNCEPKSIAKFEDALSIKLNDRNDYKATLSILGSADYALISLENKSEIFFSPTNIGNLSIQKYSVKNTSRIPIKFTWKIKPEDSFIVRVYPNEGMILPNEILTQQWIFSPKEVCRKVIKTLLTVQGISPFGSLTEPKYFPLRILGNGEEAQIDVNVRLIEFEPLVVGSSGQKSFEIINLSESTVYYKFFFVENHFEENDPAKIDQELDLKCIDIKEDSGHIHGRTRKTIRVSMRPKQRKSYQFKIGYMLIDNDDLELNFLDNQYVQRDYRVFKREIDFVRVTARGVFPSLRVTDIQASGSSVWISKINLWRNFSLDNLNVCLDSDPTTSELIYNVATRASFHRPTPVATRAIINMNMGAAPVQSNASEVRLLLENCGSVSTNMAFLFPQDLELELEYWAETGEYTEDELHQMKVQDNFLFDIKPRKATINPGESVTVLIQYFHKVVGTDRLPIIFKLDRGREILINLVGVTLDLERCYIHFSSNRHVFQPTPIGLYRAPIQYYELHNSGAVPVHYELEMDAAQQALSLDNYGISVIQCLNPIGDILPGQTHRLEWVFNPIEAKTYSVSIPIHLSSGDCPTVQFTAIGYDPYELEGSRQGGQIDSLSSGPGKCGVPSIQSIKLPDQLAQLNYERLDIGLVPTFATVRRVVFLSNISGGSGDGARVGRTVNFAWNVTNADDAEYMFVSPQNGRLTPKESIACHVIIQTRNIPRFFESNLICEIYDEQDMQCYQRDLDAWQMEFQRRTVEFTITDKPQLHDNLSQVNAVMIGSSDSMLKPTPSASSAMSLLPPVLTPNSKSRILSNKNNNQSDNSRTTRVNQRTNNCQVWLRPQLPRPFLLNFGISGRSCPIDEFQLDKPDLIKHFAINKIAMMENLNSPINVLGLDTKFPIETNKREIYLLDTVLTEIISQIIQDGDFLETVQHIKEESIPYYHQFPNALSLSDTTLDQPNSDERRSSSQALKLNKSILVNENTTEMTKEPDYKSPDLAESIYNDEESKLPKEDKNQIILESLAFGTMIENLMENMIFNIISEANNREVDLTTRPRLIALPPRSAGRKEAQK